VMAAQVPNLILQPLVENAIRHGIAVLPRPAAIRITARRENGTLHLAAAATAPGLNAPANTAEGIGLPNTPARLPKLYATDHRLELINDPAGGLRVGISIPYQESSFEPALEAS